MPTYRVYVSANILVTAESPEEAKLLAESGEFAHDEIEFISVDDIELEEGE